MSTEREKSFQLTTEDRPDYLYLRVESGKPPELEDGKALVREIAAELKKSGEWKVVVEMDVDETLSMADNFWLIEDLQQLEMHRYRIAVVDRKPEHQEVFRFADAAASNRGMTIRSFISVEDAEQWLAGK